MSDYISREEAMAFPLGYDHYDKEHGNEHFIYGVETYREWIESVPAADVAPVVHGGWIQINGHRYCNVCGHKDSPILTKYCPNCGAKMDGGDTVE